MQRDLGGHGLSRTRDQPSRLRNRGGGGDWHGAEQPPGTGATRALPDLDGAAEADCKRREDAAEGSLSESGGWPRGLAASDDGAVAVAIAGCTAARAGPALAGGRRRPRNCSALAE